MLYIRVGVHKDHGLMCMGITQAVYYTSVTICDSFAGVELFVYRENLPRLLW